MFDLLTWGGLADPSLGTWALGMLASVQFTILCVTLYLHRSQSHRALDVHPALAHLMRAWLWLTTGTSTREFAAVHRKHHAHVDTAQDPHSPQVKGLRTVLLRGWSLYRAEARNAATLERYGHGTPDDWLEHRVYRGAPMAGLVFTGFVFVLLFGPLVGALSCLVQFLWIPTWAAGVINGVGHFWGYRNFASRDSSTNLAPWGLWIGGEELHNNHHAHPTSAKLSYHWWELDIGWGVIRVLQALRLATVHRVAQRPALAALPQVADGALLARIAQQRLVIESWFQKAWKSAVEEAARTEGWSRGLRRSMRRALNEPGASLEAQRSAAARRLEEFRRHWAALQALWTDRALSRTELTERLAAWCREAEASQHAMLQALSLRIRRLA